MSFCLEGYFKRINYLGPRTATLETLKQLHQAHTQAIAFENLDALLGRTIKIDDDSVFTKLVSAGRGGWCFEQNGLFRRVLQELGFSITNLSGRVLLANPAQLPARTHSITLVTLAMKPGWQMWVSVEKRCQVRFVYVPVKYWIPYTDATVWSRKGESGF